MQEIHKQLNELSSRINRAMDQLGIDGEKSQLVELETQMAQADFWNDPNNASIVSKTAAALSKHINEWELLRRGVADALELAVDPELSAEIQGTYNSLLKQFEAKEFELKLSGPYDQNSAVVSIYAGTGGTDAQDWAQMLLRMYLRYCEQNGLLATLLEQSPGEEAGIKSASFEVTGSYAYGRLRSEKGVHRLVRLSPYNADNLRQTSFALVEAVPVIEKAEMDLDPKDLKIDVYRAGGHGGQSVNTTDSAVRITHLPTGLVVAIQNERSQLQNREKAMTVLKSRLVVLMEEQHKQKLGEIRGDNQAAAWGNQIRSYVLHPYKMVKDHRTGAETANAEAVLEGDLEPFIQTYLSSQIGK